MTKPGLTRSIFDGLRFRLLAMLSLALLPVGLIAVVQTKQLADTARLNSELSLLTRTEQATLDERVVLERARGAALLLGHFREQLTSPEQCQTYLQAFLQSNPRFSFIGILPRSGLMTCSSSGEEFDFSSFEGLAETMEAGMPTISVNQEAPLSGRSVVAISEPFFENGVAVGMVSVSVPHERISKITSATADDGFVNVLTFNRDGDILTAERSLEDAVTDLPIGQSLSELTKQGAHSFSSTDQRGRERMYSVVPIIDGVVYTLGIWDPALASVGTRNTFVPSSAFPLLMWLASLGVGLFAVHRLVIRHVRRLGKRMNAFANTRALPVSEAHLSAPTEIAEMELDFQDLAEVIMLEEANLENNLRDKNVLLKEVHHRVKNNLQLISSIMNMQIRKSPNPETREVLSRLQDRVLSLATIHRDLYQSRDAGRVEVGALVSEIVEKSIEIGAETEDAIEVRKEVDRLYLYPDQAVPVSLLASEAATNAMKYVSPDRHGKKWVEVRLSAKGAQECVMKFANSVGFTTDAESTGLGAQLINAFAQQLGGRIDIDQSEDAYRMTVTFQVADFIDDAVDY